MKLFELRDKEIWYFYDGFMSKGKKHGIGEYIED